MSEYASVLTASCPFCGARVSLLTTPDTKADDATRKLACRNAQCTKAKYSYVEIGTVADDEITWLDAPVMGPAVPEPTRRPSTREGFQTPRFAK